MRAKTRRVVVAFTIAVTLLVAGASVVVTVQDSDIGVVEAQNGTSNESVTVLTNRTDDDIVVSVSQFAFNKSHKNATIDVSFSEYNRTANLSADVNKSGYYNFTEPITGLVNGTNVTEPRPNVTVVHPQGENKTKVDVRLLRFGDGIEDQDVFEQNGSYRLPIEQAIGYSGGDDIPMNVTDGDSSKEFNASILCSGECQNVSIGFDPGQFKTTVSPLQELTYVLYPDDSNLENTSQFDLSEVSTGRTEFLDNTVVIRHPLIFRDDRYVVNVTTRDPRGQYVVRRSATERNGIGQVRFPTRVTRAESVFVQVRRLGGRDVVDTQLRSDEPSALASPPNVTYMNGSFNFSDAGVSLPASVTGVYINDTDGVRLIENVDRNGMRLVVGPVNASRPFRLLVVGEEGTARARVPALSQDTPTPTPSANATGTGLGDQATGFLFALVRAILPGAIGVSALPVFGLAGRWMKTRVGAPAVVVPGVVLLAGVAGAVLLKNSGFALEMYVSGTLIAVGTAAGSLGTFNDDGTRADLINIVPAVVLTFIGGLVVGFVWIKPGLAPTLAIPTFAMCGVLGGDIFAKKISSKHPVTVRLVDVETGEAVDESAEVIIQYPTGGIKERLAVTDGEETTRLAEGTWNFVSQDESIENGKQKHIKKRSIVKMPVTRGRVRIQVKDQDGEPISGATVTIEPETDAQDAVTLTEQMDGVYGSDLPAGTSTVTIRATHDRYQEESTTVDDVGDRLAKKVSLRPKQGSLEADVTLEDQPAVNIPVVITPRSDVVAESERRESTNQRGQVRLSDLSVGEYDVSMELPANEGQFRRDSFDNPVTVEEDQTGTGRASVRFTYELPPDARRRIRDLRDRLDSISSHPRSDVAIPSFYASVVGELIDTIEDIPEEGQIFLETGESPDETVEALLTAAESGVDAINEAMSTKQNVDLFAACGDMSDVDAEWEGTFDTRELFNLVRKENGRRRADVARRLDEVNETIDAELRDLSEVRPARDMWEATRDIARDTDRGEIEMAAVILVAEALLDAVEALFERQPLRERMTRTVF